MGSVSPRHRDLNRHQARTGGGHTFDGENRRRLVGAAVVAAQTALDGRRILLGSSTLFPSASPLVCDLAPPDTRIVELFIARGLSPRLSTTAFRLLTISSTHILRRRTWLRRCEPKPNPLGLLPITSRPLFVYKMLHRGVSHHAAACRPAAPATRLLVVCMVSTPLSHALQLGPPPCLAHSPLASASHQVSSRRFPPGGMRLGASPILPAVQCALPSPPFLHPFCSTTPSALGFPLVLSIPTHIPPPATPLRRSPLTPKTSSPPLAPPAPKVPPLAPHTPPQNSRPRPLPIPQTSPPSSLRPTPGVSPRCSPRSSARSATCCTTTR